MTVKPESAVKKFCFGAGRIPGGPSLLSLLSCPSSFPHVTTVGPRAPQVSVWNVSPRALSTWSSQHLWGGDEKERDFGGGRLVGRG